ncbi:MAG: ATP-dependent Clp protease ATP-binding subunit [Candidatus Riflebacteria bacterium]|nr:ATP-dependent Clp protease ATP-binding subunit [Candidatus Riflebacteria bacterium]
MRRKHVILYDNIHDLCIWNGHYQSVIEFLGGFFKEKEFEIILRYDPIDGYGFLNESHEKFREILKQANFSSTIPKGSAISKRPQNAQNSPTSPALQSPTSVSPINPMIPPPRGIPGNQSRPTPSAASESPSFHPVSSKPRKISPEEAFIELRIVLGNTSEAVKNSTIAAIVELGDFLTTTADQYSIEERNSIALLKKCSMEASVIRNGPLTGFRNTIVLLASELKRVPTWLYLDNPYMALIHVSRPNKEERRIFALSFLGNIDLSWNFFNGPDLLPQEIPLVAEEFADLTEGFQTLDLNALRMTSLTARIPIRPKETRHLIDFFKFGIRDDPWEKLNESKVRDAHITLSNRVIGQPKAIESVVSMLTTGKIGLTISSGTQSDKPKGIFFFVGPTGVGKTELAKGITELVFGDEKAFARFDMSEYKEEHSAEKLAGSPPGFVGYEEGGQLTNRVLRQPHSILLFDEIEKAHPRVLDKFLQILEDGRLTDGKGQTAYFNQAAIIFTSNIGASDLCDPQTGRVIRPGIMGRIQKQGTEEFTYEQVQSHFREEVQYFFASRIGRAELLSRLGDNIVVFDLLRPDFVTRIAAKFLQQLATIAQTKYDVQLQFSTSIFEELLNVMRTGDNLLYGGRRIKSILETLVERPINSWLFQNVLDMRTLVGKVLKIKFTQGKLEFQILDGN